MAERTYRGPIKKCPACEAEGRASTVYDPGGGWATAMFVHAFYDEQGRRHVHDPNTVSLRYSCSRGHEWGESESCHVCWCGYPEGGEHA